MDLSGRIRAANGRLKAAMVSVRIEARGQRLLLRATLPPKPTSTKTEPYQQRLSLGIAATPIGVSRAEKEARLIAAKLSTREFDWAPYCTTQSAIAESCGEWIGRFEAHYLDAGGSKETWQGDYLKVLKILPQDAELSAEQMLKLIEGTNPNTKTRRRSCMAAAALAKFAGLELDTKSLRGKYQPGKLDPREIPSDDEILTTWERISNPGWKWVYGMMATYGLRNHEVFHSEIEGVICKVGEKTKTGSRDCWPCYPEWFESQLKPTLRGVRPHLDLSRSNSAIGHSVTSYLSPICGFSPYSLRHAWAIRSSLFGWPVELAARQMGHSVEMHTKIYHRWINREQQQSVFERLNKQS
ncbi:MAG: hypothetical protein WBA57_08675 [Elainellaceae cyanobacterium]